MARHRRSRHRIGRQYYCRHPQCKGKSRSFGRFDNFKRHMETSHSILVSPGSANEDDGDDDAGHDRESTQRSFPPPSPSSNALPVARPKTDSQMPLMPAPLDQHSPLRQPKATSANNGKPLIGKPNILPDLRCTDREDLESLEKHELIRRLRSKLMEFEQLQHQCHVLTLERDEYAEAYRMSENSRNQGGELE
ncbi:hypothetical protein PG994_001232 [Apiospora phragmitis]|uniref:C2H2-type domain-containing protein n=1 Tax=Apiospora phragmitis TaxID=2905665 RepID=A0ABR1WSX5_9PEZI